MKISGTTGIDLSGLPINNSGNAEVEGLLTVGGNVGIGVANGDIFSIGYGKVLGISSSSVSAIELNSATGNSSFLDMGVNSTRVLSLSADASGGNITTLGALPLFLNTNGTTRATLTANGNFNTVSSSGGQSDWCQTFTSTGYTGTGSNPVVYMNYSNNSNSGTYGIYISGGSTIGGTYLSCEGKFTVDNYGNTLVRSGTGGLGYGTGSGGIVTQLTSKSTAVTLNKPTGIITMNNAALAAGATVGFTLVNSLASIGSNIIANPQGTDNYSVEIRSMFNNGCSIYVTNKTAGSLSEALQIQFELIKGATA